MSLDGDSKDRDGHGTGESQVEAVVSEGTAVTDAASAARAMFEAFGAEARAHESLRNSEMVKELASELDELQRFLEAQGIVETKARALHVHALLRQWTLDLAECSDFFATVDDEELRAERVISASDCAQMEYTHKEPVFLVDSKRFANVLPKVVPKTPDAVLKAERYVMCRAKGGIYLVACPKKGSSVKNDERLVCIMNTLAKRSYKDKTFDVTETLCDVFDSGIIEEYQRKLFPELRPYPNEKLSSSKERKQVNLDRSFEALPKSLQRAIVRAKIAFVQLTEGCEQRCPSCGVAPNGKVSAEFDKLSVEWFIKLYKDALEQTFWYFSSDPLEWESYGDLVKKLVAHNRVPYTSTTAPHGRERLFFQLCEFFDSLNDTGINVPAFRLSVMPQNFMRATVLAVATNEVYRRSPSTIVDHSGFDLALEHGHKSAHGLPILAQGRAIKKGQEFNVDDVAGINCVRGVFISPGGVSIIIPTIPTHASLQSRTGNMLVPVTVDTDRIPHHSIVGGSKYDGAIYRSPAVMYCKDANGRWVKKKMAILESEVAGCLTLVKQLEYECYKDYPRYRYRGDVRGEVIPYIPRVEAFERPWDGETGVFIEGLVADSEVGIIECFNEQAFRKHVGESVPAEYILRLVAIVKMTDEPNKFKRNLLDAAEGDKDFVKEKLADIMRLCEQAKAVLKSLHKLGLVKRPQENVKTVAEKVRLDVIG